MNHTIRKSSTSACPMCGDEEETVSYFLGQCPAFAQLRGQYFQDYYLSVNDIFDNQHISTIINFTNCTKRLVHSCARGAGSDRFDIATTKCFLSLPFSSTTRRHLSVHFQQNPQHLSTPLSSLHNLIPPASSCRTATPQR